MVSNDASDSTTMIDVRVPDGPAVLYRLSAVLAAHGVNIRSAKVATLGHEVVDVFYVQRRGRHRASSHRGEHEELVRCSATCSPLGGVRPTRRAVTRR